MSSSTKIPQQTRSDPHATRDHDSDSHATRPQMAGHANMITNHFNQEDDQKMSDTSKEPPLGHRSESDQQDYDGQATRILPDEMPHINNSSTSSNWRATKDSENQDRAIAKDGKRPSSETHPTLPHESAEATTSMARKKTPHVKAKVTGPMRKKVRKPPHSGIPKQTFDQAMEREEIQDSKERQLLRHGLAKRQTNGNRWDLFPDGTTFNDQGKPIYTAYGRKAIKLIEEYQYESSDDEDEAELGPLPGYKGGPPQKTGAFRHFKSAMEQLRDAFSAANRGTGSDSLILPGGTETRLTRSRNKRPSSAGTDLQASTEPSSEHNGDQKYPVETRRNVSKPHPLRNVVNAEPDRTQAAKETVQSEKKRGASTAFPGAEEEDVEIPQKRARWADKGGEVSLPSLTSGTQEDFLDKETNMTTKSSGPKRSAATKYASSGVKKPSPRKTPRQRPESSNTMSKGKAPVGASKNEVEGAVAAATATASISTMKATSKKRAADVDISSQVGSPTKIIRLVGPRTPVQAVEGDLGMTNNGVKSSILPVLSRFAQDRNQDQGTSNTSQVEDGEKPRAQRKLRLKFSAKPPPSTRARSVPANLGKSGTADVVDSTHNTESALAEISTSASGKDSSQLTKAKRPRKTKASNGLPRAAPVENPAQQSAQPPVMLRLKSKSHS